MEGVQLRDFEQSGDKIPGNGQAEPLILVRHKTTKEVFLLRTLASSSAAFHDMEVSRHLDHPNVAQIRGTCPTGDASGQMLVILEPFGTGGFLSDAAIRQMLPEQRLQIACGVARGLAYLHDHNVIHNDLSLENVLLDHDQRIAFITGFAQSDIISERPRYPSTTSRIAAPEKQRIPPKAMDIWSLGVILFFIFTGSIPEERIDCSKIIDERCRKICQDCLVESPQDRPNAHDILTRLEGSEEKASIMGDFVKFKVDRLREKFAEQAEFIRLRGDIAALVEENRSIREALAQLQEQNAERAQTQTVVLRGAATGLVSENDALRAELTTLRREVSEMKRHPTASSQTPFLLSRDASTADVCEVRSQSTRHSDDLKPLEHLSAASSDLEMSELRRRLSVMDRTWFVEKVAAFKESAGKGEVPGICAYACCLLYGFGVPAQMRQAARWFEKAATVGVSLAFTFVGVCNFSGFGVTRDTAVAFQWFQKAAAESEPKGMKCLADCYLRGSGTVKNVDAAFEWYRKSADANWPEGMCSLASCYSDGTGVARNLEAARELYRKAAEMGYEKAIPLLQRLSAD